MPYTNNGKRSGRASGNARSFNAARNNQRPLHKRHTNSRGGNTGGGKMRGHAYIHPSKFVNKATATAEHEPYAPLHASFDDFPLNAALQNNIHAKGYHAPSAIQDQSIPLLLEGRDVIGLANTGTGKTAAFLVPIIQKLSGEAEPLSVLILAPTRELAQQIDEQFRAFSRGMRLFSVLLVGGANIDRQVRQLQRRPQVIIATPGRLSDLMKRRKMSLSEVSTLVLDEADRMLDMGFIHDIRGIIAQTSHARQTLFFSATMTLAVRELMNEFLTDPATVSVRTADTSEQVDQDVVEAATKEEKLEKLLAMLADEDTFHKVLLFGETKYGVQRLSDYLAKNGVTSVAIHGNKSQSQRQRALRAFKDDDARVLVATDVAARGLDIPHVSHVINFDQPATYEDYIHRIGRTGRAGETGKALTFIAPRHR